MKHHGGKPDGARLKPLLEILAAHPEGVSTLTIDHELREMGVFNMAISTSIADLRKSGYQIPEAEFMRVTEQGRKIYAYRLIGKPEEVAV